MRTAPPAYLPLFRSELQVRLLGLLLLEPAGAWTVEKLARMLAAPPPSVHRELHRALDAGLLERDEETRPHRYRAARDSPLHDPLRTLLERTVGLEEELRALLRGSAGIEAAVIHGSWATGQLRNSDVDVLVVGNPDLASLRLAARRIGRHAGRRVDLTAVRVDELRSGLREANGFLAKIAAGPTKPLIGDLQALL